VDIRDENCPNSRLARIILITCIEVNIIIPAEPNIMLRCRNMNETDRVPMSKLNAREVLGKIDRFRFNTENVIEILELKFTRNSQLRFIASW
jgi:hypothetical protein